MCRICGGFIATVDAGAMREVARLLSHGGPDDCFIEHGDGWSVCNRRLAIIDLEGGRQPYDLGGKIKVVFNGENYNQDALRRELEAKGHHFADRCDGSILPALYLEHGLAFAERLEGMFAIAIVDLRAEPQLVLATNDAGMKPLYYHCDPRTGRLHFASEIRALLVPRVLGARA